MPSKIIKFNKEHLSAVVGIHLLAFPKYFLSFLGPAFLREFYAGFISDPFAIAFIAKENWSEGRVLGFIVGTIKPAGFFNKLLKRRWWAFCLSSISALSRRPCIAPRLLRALSYRGEQPPGPSRALLSSIAVAPEAQHDGVGRMLLARWVDAAKGQGSKGCYLTTDAINNDAINRFYIRAGWKLELVLVSPEGRKMNRYILDF